MKQTRIFLLSLGVCIISLTNFTCQALNLYVTDSDKDRIVNNIKAYDWGKNGLKSLKNRIDPLISIHKTDSMWIISRMAMYWKDGEHYTQCYLKNQNWDRGEGNAPVPTVRMPGMRTWNNFYNVPLADRIPYNESGDMLGLDRTDPDSNAVLVPYKESGHMIRSNNGEILSLAEDAAFLYWLEGDECYARFAADIFYTWLLGTFYMNPILDPGKSTGSVGGYEPGGICGYYDYEQIHDDLALRGAAIYAFMFDYLQNHPTKALEETGLCLKEVASTVFKRFIDIGMVRGGKSGNWNVNGWAMMIRPIMALENNDFYSDGKGRDYYLNFLLSESTPYHDAIPDILNGYDSVTGLWPESPGYAFGVIGSLLDFASILRPLDIDIIKTNPIMQKAALAVIPWMDSRGYIPVIGDCRGGLANYGAIESLLTYYTSIEDKENARLMSQIIRNGIDKGSYNRVADSWVKLCGFTPVTESYDSSARERISYSPFHRVGIIKSEPGETDLMAILYGGRDGAHLTPNGLALQLFGNGYALAPDAAGYESYWSEDKRYHQSPTGSNTIVPGYTAGDINVVAMDPYLNCEEFVSSQALTPWISMMEMEADEKCRLVAAITGEHNLGYYIDIFRSDQPENDYIFHNVGKDLSLYNGSEGKNIMMTHLREIPVPHYHEGYGWFSNIRKAAYNGGDVKAVWDIEEDGVKSMIMHIPSENSRELFLTDAPYTTLNPSLTPGGVSSAPGITPSLILRQKGSTPVIAVFEPVTMSDENILSVSRIINNSEVSGVKVKCRNEVTDLILSSKNKTEVKKNGLKCDGELNILRTKGKKPILVYLLDGTQIEYDNMKIESETPLSLALYCENGKWYYSSTGEAQCRIGKKCFSITPGYNMELNINL